MHIGGIGGWSYICVWYHWKPSADSVMWVKHLTRVRTLNGSDVTVETQIQGRMPVM